MKGLQRLLLLRPTVFSLLSLMLSFLQHYGMLGEMYEARLRHLHTRPCCRLQVEDLLSDVRSHLSRAHGPSEVKRPLKERVASSFELLRELNFLAPKEIPTSFLSSASNEWG